MNISFSDVNGRLAKFRETLSSIEETRRQGGFESVSPEILEYMENAEPVGLDKKNNIAWPRSYRPENGPAVLMLHPHEQETRLNIRGRSVDTHVAENIAEQSGLSVAIGKRVLDSTVTVSSHAAYVQHRTIELSPHDEREPYSIAVPRLLVMGNDIPPELMGPTIAHETDHWDFFLNTAGGLQGERDEKYSWPQLQAIAEKRGYKTSYDIEQSLGNYRPMDPLSTLVERHRGIQPAEVQVMHDDFVERRIQAGVDRKITRPLAVLAITELFGASDKLITEDELLAFQTLKVIL